MRADDTRHWTQCTSTNNRLTCGNFLRAVQFVQVNQAAIGNHQESATAADGKDRSNRKWLSWIVYRDFGEVNTGSLHGS
jgi:hypothetical protein